MGLGPFEFLKVLVVVVGDILVRDRDFRDDLAVDQLLDGEFFADLVLQVVHGEMLFVQLALELFRGVGALGFGELVLDFAVARLQAQFLGALQENLIVDQRVEDIQHERERFFLRRRGALRIDAQAVIFFDLGARNFRAVDDGPHPGRWCAILVAPRRQ